MSEWQPIENYNRPSKKEGEGERVLLGHWADYGKEQYYFGVNDWLWIASGSLGYNINNELNVWIDKDDDFMPLTNDFNKVTHFMPLPARPQSL